MSIITDIFGGGDQTVKNLPYSAYTADVGLDYLRNNTGNRQYYSGNKVAGFDPNQIQGFEQMMQSADNVGAQGNKMQGVNNNYLSDDFLDPGSNPRINAMMDAATRGTYRQLDENTLPALRGNARATGAQQYGNSRNYMRQAIAGRGAEDRATDLRANLLENIYGRNMGAQQNAMRMQPMINNMMMQPGRTRADVGSKYQQLEQMNNTSNMAEYDYNRDIKYNDINNMLNQNKMQGSSQTQSGQGPGSGIMGALMMMYGGGMFSGGDGGGGYDYNPQQPWNNGNSDWWNK